MTRLGLDVFFSRCKSARRSAEPVGVCFILLFGLASVCEAAEATELRVNIYLDQRRNDAEVKRVEAEVWSPAFGYRQQPVRDGAVVIEPSSKPLMDLWKGNAELTEDSGDLFESPLQFLPVMLVVEVSNPSAVPLEIGRAYLRVAESLTDRQPLVRMPAGGCGAPGPAIVFSNDGWRTAENAVLEFSLGPKESRLGTFRAELGPIGNVAFEPERALMSSMPALGALRAKPPQCGDYDQLDSCLKRLERTGQLGRLTGKLRHVGLNYIGVDVSGTLSFEWKHHPSNEMRQQRRAFRTVVSVFRVDLTNGPECGAGGPGEGGFDAVPLRTDASHYEVPLPYRGPLDARGNRRFELTLKPNRSSTHRFEAVVETSDGRIGVSPPVSLLYFVPTTTRSPLRALR